MTSLWGDLADALPGLRTSVDEADRVAYARDLWPRHHMAVRAGRPAEHRPGAIAWPTSTEEVARLVGWARRRGVALVPFGAGSGVCAGVLPREGVLVVDLKRLARIRRIDARAPFIEVEAGHMGVPLEQALERRGLTLGHFPSSILCSTVGGWVAARSAGQSSGAYGKIEDMVVDLECVTGDGEVVALRQRASGPNLVPLVVGSEGTLAIVTCATLRLHPAPTSHGFGAWSFPTTEHGWAAMRSMFQAGLRPAVARLYDPFDAALAKQAAVEPEESAGSSAGPRRERAPGLGGVALRAALRRPGMLNQLLRSRPVIRALGGALLIVVFEGRGDAPQRGIDDARRLTERLGGEWEGEGPARRWLQHRYSVSYRQAPVFANGAFVDTMEVAARWSKVGELYESVRRALGQHVFVMAHFSHAYPDGCCIYFSFAGSAGGSRTHAEWDDACVATYDRTWRAALVAAVEAGGTLAHHHGVGRSKAPRLRDELGAGVDVVRALMRAFDPRGILNPGNLVPDDSISSTVRCRPSDDSQGVGGAVLDRESLLVHTEGGADLALLEQRLNESGLTLDARLPSPPSTVGSWLGRGAPGARDRWLDPVDQLVAGMEATLTDGRGLRVRPAPRRAVGPDLTALFIGADGRFGQIERAWLRVHERRVARPTSAPFEHDRDPPLGREERVLLDAIAASLRDQTGSARSS